MHEERGGGDKKTSYQLVWDIWTGKDLEKNL